MEPTKIVLRILYTINSSPQYILARSSVPVPVTPIPNPHFQYATVSLKTCLDCICRSSPELVQDASRDFSVYVLDPLESSPVPASVNILSATSDPSSSKPHSTPPEPKGVAVGLGLMSWALRADEKDGLVVNGTLIKLGTGQLALEVIFALRETAAIQKDSFPAALRSWSLPNQPSTSGHTSSPGPSRAAKLPADVQPKLSAYPSSSTSAPSSRYRAHASDVTTRTTIASIQMRTQQKAKHKKAAKPPPPSPKSEADRIMLARGIYIGPVKKKGRPVRSVNPTSVGSQDTADQLLRESSRSSLPARANPEQEKQPTPLTQSNQPEPNLLDLLAYFSATSGDPTAALLTAFNAIDSSAGTDGMPSPALVIALKDLFGALGQQQPQQQNASSVVEIQVDPTLALATSHRKNQSADDEVVLLDKENINPSAFRRRIEKNGKTGGTRSSPVRSSLGSNLSNTLPVAAGNGNPTASNPNRKRRLSDFMDEKEAQKSKGKSKETENHVRRDSSSKTLSDDLSRIRYYPRVVSDYPFRRAGTHSYYRTRLETWTSPVKPSTNPSHPALNDESSREKPIVIPDSPQAQRNIASSPARPKPVSTRKRYVVPEWARTDTSMQPRLSEEAQQALKQKEEGESMKKAEKRKRSGEAQVSRLQNRLGKMIKASSRPDPPKPIAASSDNFVFPTNSASEHKTAVAAPATPRQTARPLPWLPIAQPNANVLSTHPLHNSILYTPPRRRSENLFTPDGDASLFTPLWKSASSRIPQMPLTPSPTKVRGFDQLEGMESDGMEAGDDLDHELDSALEALDIPTISAAGNANKTNENLRDAVSEFQHHRPDADDEYMEPPMKQHWIGLPPSSPPPPSSPSLSPHTVDEGSDVENRELPIATSEADDCTMDAEDISTSSQEALLAYTDDEMNSFFSFPDIGESQTNLSSDSMGPQMDYIFDPFARVCEQVGSVAMTPTQGFGNTQADIESSAPELDFREFWNVFIKPFMPDGSGKGVNVDAINGTNSLTLGTDFGQLDGVEVTDHRKLAEEIQSLFSGCLV